MTVPHSDGDYQVSNTGKVKSMERTAWNGRVEHKLRERILKQINSPGPYMSVNLFGRVEMVHRLVLEAFVGPCPDGMECCHYDGNPKNNNLDNLRWDTPKSNQGDRYKHASEQNGVSK